MSRITVVGLYTYLVKGMQGVRFVGSHRVTARGLQFDRRFMLVDPEGNFITQRECPELATFLCDYNWGYSELLLRRGQMHTLQYRRASWETGERTRVTVWKDTVEAVVQNPKHNAELSRALGRPVRLVYIPDSSMRPSRGQREGEGQVLNGFADGFPFLLTSEESLADLNARIGGDSAIGMDRFRPNIVVRGCSEAFEEETWREFRIGNVKFFGMKRCGRCIVTTTDQQTGERMGKEPLKTLARYRRFGSDACFGMNLNHANTGSINVGDEVEIIERGPPFIDN